MPLRDMRAQYPLLMAQGGNRHDIGGEITRGGGVSIMHVHHAVKDKRATVLGPVKQPEMDFMSHRGITHA